MTTAFKFLRPGRVAPFTRVTWPNVGEWLETKDEPELCRSGIHALRPSALPCWLAEELWRVELEDDREAGPGILLARRGRLTERVEAWDDQAARDFAGACLLALPHRESTPIARERAVTAIEAAREAAAGPSAASMAYIAAKAAEADRPNGYEQERERQAAWLEERLHLLVPGPRPGAQ
jgi:hypothetical protein